MPNRVKAATLALVFSVALPAQASSQIEFGIDPFSLGVDVISDVGETRTLTRLLINLPTTSLQTFRVGFFVSDKVSVEPRISVDYVKFEGSDATSKVTLSLGALVHFTAERQRPQAYIRPLGSIFFVDRRGSSATQVSLGVGLGVKLPILQQLAARLEAQYAHAFEGDSPSVNSLAAVFGLSFFTR